MRLFSTSQGQPVAFGDLERLLSQTSACLVMSQRITSDAVGELSRRRGTAVRKETRS